MVWVFDFDRLNEKVGDCGEDSVGGPKADGETQAVVDVCSVVGVVLAEEVCGAEEDASKEG